MPRWLKITGIGCGGLLGLIILIAVIASLGGGGGEAPVQEQAGDQPEEAREEGGQNTVAIGEPLTVGDTAWIVTAAEQVTEITDELGQSETGNFVVVDFEFTNNSPEAITLESGMLTLIDSEGNENEVDTDRLLFVPAERNILFEQVNPGVTQQGTVIYTVAEGASGFTLELAGGFFATEVGYVDLGF